MSRTLFNGLHLTEHRKGGKMDQMDSFMLRHGYFCENRTVGVCKKCYSKKLSGYRPFLAAKQEKNSVILSDPGFCPVKMNTINGAIRWSSFGEIENRVQFENITKMARVNKHLVNVLWTKKAGLVRNIKKPKNLRLVWSATKIDVLNPFIPKGFEMAFFVYSKEELIPDGVFHCNKQCSACGFCYQAQSAGIIGEVIR